MDHELVGDRNIMFVTGERPLRVEVVSVITDEHAHPIFIIGKNGTYFNWSNILWIK